MKWEEIKHTYKQGFKKTIEQQQHYTTVLANITDIEMIRYGIPQEKYQQPRYANDTILKELKSLLMKVKEESEKAGLKLIQNLFKKWRSWHPILSLQGQ